MVHRDYPMMSLDPYSVHDEDTGNSHAFNGFHKPELFHTPELPTRTFRGTSWYAHVEVPSYLCA
jgi:hypothetical protein